jgi:hypothetical protein
MIPRIFVGVDPGSTTGIAVLRTTGNGYISAHDQIVGPEDVAYWLRKHCEGQFVELIYESFYIAQRTLKAGTKGVHDALNLIGWINIEIGDWIGVRLYPQSPSEGKTIKNDALKAMGLYNPAMRHGTDAMRHIVRHHLNKLPKSPVSKAYLEALKV